MTPEDEARRPPRAAERRGGISEEEAHHLLKLCREGRLDEVESELERGGANLADAAGDWRVALAHGWVAARHGRNAEAERALMQAVEYGGAEPEPALLLGRLYRVQGRLADAAKAYRLVLEFDGRHPDGRAELAQTLHGLGADGEAKALLQPLRAEAREDAWPAERLYWLAAAYTRIGGLREALPLLEAAADAAPTQFSTGHALRHLRGRIAQPWHFSMMRDEARHAAYAEALAQVVTPDSLVLEIGSGSGVLAMLAARAGARHVYTCESEPLLAETARRIVARNGLADRITVIGKPSQALRVEEDLPEPADILISELLGDTVFSENLLEVTADARARLLKPGAALVPWKVSAMTSLAGGPRLAAACRVGEAAGFDLSLFNRFAPRILAMDLTAADYQVMSAPQECFAADLARPPRELRRELFSYRVTAGGEVDALLQWNRLYLAGEVVFENPPPETWRPSSWRHSVFVFDRPLEVADGDDVEVTGLHNGKLLSFLEGRWR